MKTEKDGFKVQGHFRSQPYKNEKGEWTRKIIYIEEYKKHKEIIRL